jgi:UDP-glucose 6-dehydrogenase
MNTQKYNIGMLGMGEVGGSLVEILSKKYNVSIRTRKVDDFSKMDILHVAIPFSKDFVKTVVKVGREFKPKLIIIHSTVEVGTTRKISKLTNIPTCHSPVRGIHPNLVKGIMTFPKYLGCSSRKGLLMAKKHLEGVGIKVITTNKPENTELLKLMDTTYYYWCVAFEKETHKICKKFKADFNVVYTSGNETYNKGYTELGMSHVVRPVLKHVEGHTGGHCLTNNVIILNKQYPNMISRTLITLEKNY